MVDDVLTAKCPSAALGHMNISSLRHKTSSSWPLIKRMKGLLAKAYAVSSQSLPLLNPPRHNTGARV